MAPARAQTDKDCRGRNRRILNMVGAVVVAGWIGVILMFLGLANPPGPSSTVLGGEATLQIGHLFLFGLLGLLISAGAMVVSCSQRLTVALLAGLGVGGALAILTESYQLSVSGRSGNLEDVLTDIVGTAIGATLAWMIQLWLTRPRQSREPNRG